MGKILTGEKPKYAEKNLSQCHLVHHKSHTDWSKVNGLATKLVSHGKACKTGATFVYEANEWYSVVMYVDSQVKCNEYDQKMANTMECAAACSLQITIILHCQTPTLNAVTTQRSTS